MLEQVIAADSPEPARPTASILTPDSCTVVFVWSVWGLALLAALAFVRTYGSRWVLFLDSWEIVPALTGQQPVTAGWLWSQHNEHRVLLPRLIQLAVVTVTGGDFRTIMFLDVFALAAVALGLILAAKRLRGGWVSYTDAFFPLALLNLAQRENL